MARSGLVPMTQRDWSQWISCLALVKLPLSLSVTLSAFVGYLLQKPFFSMDCIFLSGAVLLLCMGASLLNNYQDRDWDRRFSRTSKRALPRRIVEPRTVLRLGFCLVGCGLFGLYLVDHSYVLLLLGGCAVLVYNLIYTPLKRRSAWASVLGTVCGILPLWLGWIAAGGGSSGVPIWLLSILLLLWQLPHCWVLLLVNREDYIDQSVPSLLALFSDIQIRRINLLWVMAFATGSLLVPLLGIVETPWAGGFLLVNVFAILLTFSFLMFQERRKLFRYSFYHLTFSLLVILVTITADRLMG